MTDSTPAKGALKWALPPAGGAFVYEYTHHRVVAGGGGLRKDEAVADRRAELIFTPEPSGEAVRVVLTNIDDTGCIDGERVELPPDRKSYPIVVFDQSGRILENLSPPTFPLAFSPELEGLTQGSSRRSDFSAPFKSGFGRALAQGTVCTTWESTEPVDGSLCAVLVTTFDLQSVPGGYPWSPDPPRFRGRTVAHFDLEVGRLALLESTSETEQTIGWKRIRQELRMTFRYLRSSVRDDEPKVG